MNIPLTWFLQSLVIKYFLNDFSRCLIIITNNNHSMNINLPISIVNIQITSNNITEQSPILFNYFGCQDFILYVSNPAVTFRSIEQAIKHHDDRFNRRKYVIITPPMDEAIKFNPFSIFRTKEIQFVSDLIAVTVEEETVLITGRKYEKFMDIDETTYDIWTHKFNGISNHNKVYLLDKWYSQNKSFLYDRNLFPNKLKNQKKKTLKTAVFSYPPYTYLETKDNKTFNYMGSEMVTIQLFAESLNMTLKPIINSQYYWGEIWNNWSGNGLLGNIGSDNADLGGAALYTWETYYKFLDYSKPTVRTGITCLVTAPKLLPGWLTPFYVYTLATWLATMITYIVILVSVMAITIFHLNRRHNTFYSEDEPTAEILNKIIMSVTKPFLTQNVSDNELIGGNLNNYLMALVFGISLILSTSYFSGLSAIMTIPRYENPINTISDFVESGLSWGATQEAWVLSLRGSTEENHKKIVSRFVETSEENLRELSLTGHFAFSIERLPDEKFAIGTYIKEDTIQNFRVLKEDLYWEMCVIMTRKNSILLPYLDDFILKVFEAGLITFWQNNATAFLMDQKVQRTVKYFIRHKERQNVVKLQLTHVEGAFGILLIGNTIALIVFVLEILNHKYFHWI